MKRYLIVGSGPSATLLAPYTRNLNKYFDAIFAINNAWYLVKDIDFYWSVSTDFDILGTIKPDTQLKRMSDYFGTSLLDGEELHHLYDPDNLIPYGTMYLNTLYQIISGSPETEPISIYVIGSDFDYSNQTTHFYGTGKMNNDTSDMIKNNVPELAGKAADPLRAGRDNLIRLLNQDIPNNVTVISLSPNTNQLLPYYRITLEYIFQTGE